ncbi:MAG: AMP-binding protein [Clostridia bacterium]|nr:AMP-binding protein [Clostridia bacterium]
MDFVNERRKVFCTVEGQTWCFKAVDGSVIEAPDGADQKLTDALASLAKEQELVSGTGTASVKAGKKKYEVSVERLLDLTAGDLLHETAQLYPDGEALIYKDGSRRINYRQFDEDSTAFAKYLLSIGVKKGDHVGLWMANGIESLTICYAISKIGAVVAPFTPYEKQDRMEEMVRRAEVSTFILYRGAKTTENIEMLADDMYPEIKEQKYGELNIEKAPLIKRVILVDATDEYAYPGVKDYGEALEEGRKMADDELEARRKEFGVKDLAYIIFTSGSTGFPKGVMLSHLNIVENSNTMMKMMGLTHEDRMCVQIQLFHTFGSVASAMTGIQAGIPMLLLSRFKPEESLKFMENEKITVVSGVPTMFIGYIDVYKKNPDEFDTTMLKKGIVAGAPCPEKMVREIKELLHIDDLIVCYGLTETSPCVSATKTDDTPEVKGTTVGRLVPGVTVKLVDPETEEPVPDGEAGELCVSGYSLMMGYLNDPEKTAATYTKDGWLKTGDLAYILDDGYIRLGDRLKDIIIRSGENISPGNVEKVLLEHPDVEQAYVIGVKDYKYGEIVGTFCHLKDGSELKPEELRKFCVGKTPTLSIPSYYWFVDEFPLLANGKVSKPELRKMAEEMKENTPQVK